MESLELKSLTEVNTGSGENAATVEMDKSAPPITAASSETCQPSDKQPTPKTSGEKAKRKQKDDDKPAPELVAQLIYSALSYAEKAGMMVRAGNTPGGALGIAIFGFHWDDAAPDKIQVGPPPKLNLDA